ncbi:O-antigen ligase family protein [Arthrobacter sp. TMN-37]
MAETKPHTATAVVIWIILIVSVTSWRKGVYFEGAVDAVVVAKAVLQGIALTIALLLKRAAPTAYPVAGGPFLVVIAVLAVSMIGALSSGGTLASAVLAVRILLLAVTVVLLVSIFPRQQVLLQLVIATGIVGGVLAVTGIGTLASGGRLEGTLLPISPNGLVVLCAVPALAAIHRVISGRAAAGVNIAACFYALACIATQSRTALLGMAVALVVIVLSVQRIQRYIAVVLVMIIPALVVFAVYTTFFESLVNREDSASNTTLNSRTIAWDVVLSTPFELLQKWVGAGLSVKTVNVRGQYWNEQVLDSTWVSALAQTGLIGTALLAVLAAAVLVTNLRGGRDNALPLAVLVFLLIGSFLETGLLDSSVNFIIFLALASTFVPPRREDPEPRQPLRLPVADGPRVSR